MAWCSAPDRSCWPRSCSGCWRSRQPGQPGGSTRPRIARPSVVARGAAAAGLPAAAVVASRNALESGSGPRAVPVRATLLGSIAAVTAVIVAVVFGTSLTGLISHPARYGWNWQILIQAEGGYGNFAPGVMNRLVGDQPVVAGWSSFGFSQLMIDGRIVPVLGLQRQRGSVQPPTTSGQPVSSNDQIELGTVTLRELGKKVGDTVLAGIPPYRRVLTIVGTVTLPSFGVAVSDHVSLGRGGMLTEQALLAAEGAGTGRTAFLSSQAAPSAVAIDLVPGTTAAQRARLVHRITSANPDQTPGGTYELRLNHARAAAILNTAQMGGQPLALALGLATAAVLSLALTVLTSVRRRRRELALLKTLGMTRRQVRAIVAWQTTLTLGIAIAVGVPLGIAAGRWAWRSFAGSLGVAPVTVVPLLLLAAGGAALIAGGQPAGRRARGGRRPDTGRGHAAHRVTAQGQAGGQSWPVAAGDRAVLPGARQPAHSPQNVTCTWSMVKPAPAPGARQAAGPIAAPTSATAPHRRQTIWCWWSPPRSRAARAISSVPGWFPARTGSRMASRAGVTRSPAARSRSASPVIAGGYARRDELFKLTIGSSLIATLPSSKAPDRHDRTAGPCPSTSAFSTDRNTSVTLLGRAVNDGGRAAHRPGACRAAAARGARPGPPPGRT